MDTVKPFASMSVHRSSLLFPGGVLALIAVGVFLIEYPWSKQDRPPMVSGPGATATAEFPGLGVVEPTEVPPVREVRREASVSLASRLPATAPPGPVSPLEAKFIGDFLDVEDDCAWIGTTVSGGAVERIGRVLDADAVDGHVPTPITGGFIGQPAPAAESEYADSDSRSRPEPIMIGEPLFVNELEKYPSLYRPRYGPSFAPDVGRTGHIGSPLQANWPGVGEW